MGFFKNLRDILRSEPSVPSSQSQNAWRAQPLGNSSGTSTDQARPRSALPPGRMEKTNVIKGPECHIPRGPGAYRHIDKETKEVLYVGQSNDLRVRQQQHARAGRHDTTKHDVQYASARPDATKDDLCRTEQCHIARHKPTGNKTKGGNGRR